MSDSKSFYKLLFKVAFPIMIQYFITSSVNMMDSFMIGKLGEEAVAALGISNQYFFMFNLLMMGICSGCNVLIAQFWGKEDVNSIRRVLGVSLVLGISTSIVFLIGGTFFNENIIYLFNKSNVVISLGKDYLTIVSMSYVFTAISLSYGIGSRGVQQTVVPMVCSSVAFVLNVVFNYGLIFGNLGMPALGIKGAAMATLIARVVEMVLIICLIYGKGHVLKASFKTLIDFDRGFFKRVMDVTIPVIINEICWGLGIVIYAIIYGNMGTRSMAAVQICTSIQNMFLIVLFAMANGACAIVGTEVGRGDYDKSKYYSKKLLETTLVLSVIIGIILVISSKYVLKIYNVSDEVYMNAYYMIVITSIVLPARFIGGILIVGILRGGGDTKYVLRVEFMTMWFIGVPLCLIGAILFKLRIYEVYMLVTLEEVVKCVVSFTRYKSGKWIKNLTVAE
ncbi:MAG: MATE family efflux transporter [Anaeromicrobium sp.]|jgi:putative MATE family efflux protein|uniref:MATE family efflux transporter n=1 Tax=Anaeromicrobium sp. TaxID=1929132 RepID=UPI0025E03EB2|nr:MATE family efflux transporter [Anaeromicrobium sp.]MCT4593603.1 MATE family efflux transporter [Anaeromicrobium sp.]